MQIKGVMNELGVAVMPVINETLTEFVQMMRENKDTIKTFVSVLADGFKLAGKALVGVMKAVPVLVQVIQNAHDFWVETFAKGFALADETISDVVGFFSSAKDSIVSGFNTAVDTVAGAIGFVVETFETAQNFIMNGFETAKDWLFGLPDTVAGIFEDIKSGIESWWGGIKASASSWVSSIVDSLVAFIMDKVSWLADSLKSLPIVGSLLEGDSPLASGSGSVTINVNNSVDARGAAPGAGAEISRAVQASSGQSGQAVAAAMANYQSLSYAG